MNRASGVAAPGGDPGFRYSIDRLVLSGGRLFGWGWVAHPARPVTELHLRLEGDGWERRVPGAVGLSRDDVEAGFPGLSNAATSGFVVTGYIPGTPRRVWLEAQLDDGSGTCIDITRSAERQYTERMKRRRLGYLVRAVWRRLARGDLVGLVRRARAQSYAAPSLDDLSIVEELLPLLRPHPRVSIIFDHNMGGGANQYREQTIAARLAEGGAVLLCTYNLPMLEYRLHLRRTGEKDLTYRISSFVALERVLEAFGDAELFVNSPVSFEEPLLLADWLARMRAEHAAVRLTLTVHDYFTVCPSFVLLDADGRYCGIPDVSECARCLPRHEASYVALTPPTEIGPWRALWGRCLQEADEVRCFSQSSLNHLLRAYPALARERITVIPHRVDFKPPRKPRLDAAAPLVVGVVGEISEQKGALVVKALIERIDRESLDIRLVVLGTLHAVHRSERLDVTGPYRREDLAELIESHRINMVLFPSIWPETFSYVVAEMAALGMPIVAFDLGAPAERLRAYPLARLVTRVDADAALDTLVDFHRVLAEETRSAQRPSRRIANP